jgi:hypothetical protein
MSSSSRGKVAKYRASLRARGLRPVQLWLPDTSRPEFLARAAQEVAAINGSPDENPVMEWIERNEAWPGDAPG